MDSVGNVIVTRTTNTDGYTWIVSFASCRADETSGVDTCNIGDVNLLTFAGNSSLAGCADGGLAASSMVVVNGSAGTAVDVTDLSSGPPYRQALVHVIWRHGTVANFPPSFRVYFVALRQNFTLAMLCAPPDFAHAFVWTSG